MDFLDSTIIVKVKTLEEAEICKKVSVGAVLIELDSDSNMIDINLIKKIKESVKIPIIANCRKGHITEAQILNFLEVDIINEQNSIDDNFILEYDKSEFKSKFMIGITDLGEAARGIDNNYSVLRTLNKKNNLNEILKIYNDINEKIKEFNTYKNINSMNGFCKRQCCDIQTIKDCANLNRLPVTFIAEGEIKNPIDAALMMRIGFDSVIVENCIFDNNNPEDILKVIVNVVKNYEDLNILCNECMKIGINSIENNIL